MISIIVPIYNTNEFFLRECINSILCQTYRDYEVLLIDDGSNIQTKKILSQIAKLDSRIAVISQENGGVSNARNHGLDVAKGEYICFVDADDILAKDFLMTALSSIENADLVVGKVVWFNCKNEIVRTNFDSRFSEKSEELYDFVSSKRKIVENFMGWPESEDDFLKGFQPEVWGKLYKRSLINGQTFSEQLSIGEDVLFFLEYLVKCKKILVINSVFYKYRLNNDSAMNCIDHSRIEKYYNFIDKTIDTYSTSLLEDALPSKIYYEMRELYFYFYCNGKVSQEDYKNAISAVSSAYHHAKVREVLKKIKKRRDIPIISILMCRVGINGMLYELFIKRQKQIVKTIILHK